MLWMSSIDRACYDQSGTIRRFQNVPALRGMSPIDAVSICDRRADVRSTAREIIWNEAKYARRVRNRRLNSRWNLGLDQRYVASESDTDAHVI